MTKVYHNPITVAVALIPVCRDNKVGLLVIRRGGVSQPGFDQEALCGGYVEVGETWQAGLCREIKEEIGVEFDPATIRIYESLSTPNTTKTINFGVTPWLTSMPKFVPNKEVLGIRLIWEPIELAFSTHTQVVQTWFQRLKDNMMDIRELPTGPVRSFFSYEW
jgi:ADP-ribose pyrophosphatase YjhB (NUDIX family)